MNEPRVSGEQINDMTMEVSFILTKYGVKGYEYNECLNALRSSIQNSLSFNSTNHDPMLGHGVNWREIREKLTK
jgi:hypothetical protein